MTNFTICNRLRDNYNRTPSIGNKRFESGFYFYPLSNFLKKYTYYSVATHDIFLKEKTNASLASLEVQVFINSGHTA